MEKKVENKTECIGCKHYYLYYSYRKGYYLKKDSEVEVGDPWVPLDLEKIPSLIKLLENHKSNLENNSVNLNTQKKSSELLGLTENYSDFGMPGKEEDDSDPIY